MPYFGDYVFDSQGNVVPGATITVATQAGAAATIYSDALRTTTITSLTTGSDGSYEFYIASGRYTITAQYQGFSQTDTFDLGVAGIETVTDFGADPTGVADSTAAIQAALDYVHANGLGEVTVPAGTYLTGEITWPGNNITLRGAGSAYSYNTANTPRTIFKAKAGTTTVFNLVQTGTSEDRKGNHLVDFSVDGNAIAADGIRVSGANTIERVRVKGCTAAGARLMNFTNSTHVLHCGFNSNSGWGLVIEGVSSTIFSVTGTNTSLNTLGGILIEGGFGGHFKNVVSESNSGPGLKINRPASNTNSFGDIIFDTVWLEDNASVSPFYTLTADSYNDDPLRNIYNVIFRNCRISASSVTRKYLNLSNVNGWKFEDCSFGGSTEATALTLDGFCTDVAFIESANTYGGSQTGLTDAQLDSAIATGVKCYSSDRSIKRVVDAGAPAAAFTNSWVNYGAPFATAKYWFDREGNVHLEGGIKSGTLATSALTLPVGYRPSASQVFAVSANGAIGVITIAANGTVVMSVASATYTSLDGIAFQTG